jgi:hypothetical protein
VMSASVITPVLFWASLAPWANATDDAETTWPSLLGRAAAELSRPGGATCAARPGAVDAGRPGDRPCLGGSVIRPRPGRSWTRWPRSAWPGCP